MIQIAGNRFSVSSSLDDIQRAFDCDGYVIIENILNANELRCLNDRIGPLLDEIRPDTQNPFNGQFTKRFGRLAYRIPESRTLIKHPLVTAFLDRVLLKCAKRYKLTFSGVMHLMEGQKVQIGHRDNSHLTSYDTLLLATMWAMNDFTYENGATLLVPGSHKWFHVRKPTSNDVRVAEMSRGSVLLYDGNVIHGAGECKRGFRTGLSLQYCVSWLQQEENQALAVPYDVLKTFDEELLKILGFDIISRNCGEIDSKHPIDFILNDDKQRSLAPPDSAYDDGNCKRLVLKTEQPIDDNNYFDLSR